MELANLFDLRGTANQLCDSCYSVFRRLKDFFDVFVYRVDLVCLDVAGLLLLIGDGLSDGPLFEHFSHTVRCALLTAIESLGLSLQNRQSTSERFLIFDFEWSDE